MEPTNYHILLGFLVGAIHVLGVLSAIDALMSARSSQSAIAWAISCITFPYIAVPAYWIFGRSYFEGYVSARRSSNARFRELVGTLRTYAPEEENIPEDFKQSCDVFEKLASMPFTLPNQVNLLIDGDDAFKSIIDQIRPAKNYILIQFYIVRSDKLGQEILQLLSDKIRNGVRVYFMYDRIGSYGLSKRYIRALEKAGVQVAPFKTTHIRPKRFQINFRNHRKMVVVDGRWATIGGANLGVEYCGRSKRFGYWRDTMVEVRGPAVQEIQLSFAEDWFFLRQETLDLNWNPEKDPDHAQCVLVLPTGPADDLHACSMMFTQAIHMASDRLWITSPYFVPDNEIIRALQLAALRGVDVRILLPETPDNHLVVYWASFTYLKELEDTGVKFLRYTKGLLHEKVILVDDQLALVGSANADNRSFYLAFEITLVVADKKFASEVESMLEEDFSHSRPAGQEEFRGKGLIFRLKARLSRLFAPVL